MQKRFFIAVDLPTNFAEVFEGYRNTLKIPELHWTKEENFHLTIVFLGYLEDSHLPEINNLLSETAKANQPFKLNFENITFAPPNIVPRMIWAKFSLNEHYSKLVDEVFQKLESYITEQNRVEKIPHITLARFQENSQFKDQSLPQPTLDDRALEISQFTLYESQPTTEGSSYTQIADFRLGI